MLAQLGMLLVCPGCYVKSGGMFVCVLCLSVMEAACPSAALF
jgi:hypothetical protein